MSWLWHCIGLELLLPGMPSCYGVPPLHCQSHCFNRKAVYSFRPFVVALNVFVVYLFLAVFYLLFKTSWNQKTEALRGIFALEGLSERVLQFLGFFAFAFLFSWVLPYFSESTRLQVGGFLGFVLILTGFQLYKKMMDRIRVGIFSVFSVDCYRRCSHVLGSLFFSV